MTKDYEKAVEEEINALLALGLKVTKGYTFLTSRQLRAIDYFATRRRMDFDEYLDMIKEAIH